MFPQLDALAMAVNDSPAKCGGVQLVTIEGPAGSGKTTLADALSRVMQNVQVVHMDELYDGWDDALVPHLWTRIEQALLLPLSQGHSAHVATYNWTTQTFDTEIMITPSDVVILEGVGSGHPLVKAFASYNIWISGPEELLLDRVLQRDGEHLREHMLAWQIAEREYFENFQIEANADIHLTGN